MKFRKPNGACLTCRACGLIPPTRQCSGPPNSATDNGLTNSFSAFGSSENKRLTEKFTRVSEDRVDYEFTVGGPATFTDRIVGLIPVYKVAGQIYEYACHEGNYGMVNILRGARVAEQGAESPESAQ